MPRQPRRKGELCIYHVILRGNERKKIFETDEDKKRFLKILTRTKDKYHFLIYAYCLMDNHAHLLLNCNGNDISLLMKSINISYASYYNRKYKRSGHLFQDRFRSELIGDDPYFLQVSKYIHRNPVKARMVKNVEDYQWSSYGAYMGKASEKTKLTDTDELLGIFASDRQKAITGYVKFVSEKEAISVMDIEEDMINDDDGHLTVITDKKQAEEVLLNMMSEHELPNIQDPGTVKLRNIFIRQIKKNSILTLKEIGELFGGLSESRVSRILRS